MFKTFVIALATTALGAGTADACPRRCSSPCTTSACTTMTAPAAPAAPAADAPAATAQARSGERTYRSFSYEPSQRSYSAPRMRSSQAPAYALPKTDSRKFGGR